MQELGKVSREAPLSRGEDGDLTAGRTSQEKMQSQSIMRKVEKTLSEVSETAGAHALASMRAARATSPAVSEPNSSDVRTLFEAISILVRSSGHQQCDLDAECTSQLNDINMRIQEITGHKSPIEYSDWIQAGHHRKALGQLHAGAELIKITGHALPVTYSDWINYSGTDREEFEKLILWFNDNGGLNFIR